MKNTFGILSILIAVVLGGIGMYNVINKSGPKTSEPDKIVEQKSEKYMHFTPEVLVSTTSTRRVLFFYANWCPICKQADESFAQNVSKIPSDVTLIRVNYNDTDTDKTEKELAAKYGIVYQHTFVQINASGNEVAKWNGGQIDDLLSNVK